jgi:uncharacterized membrane protein
MNGSRQPLLALLLPIALLGAYDGLAHYVSTFPDAARWAIAITLLPAASLALGLLARRLGRLAAIVAGLAAAAAGVLLWPAQSAFGEHLSGLYLAQHLGTNLTLVLYFGRSLGAGRTPVCTTFAAVVHPAMPPRVARYTRRLTLAWTLFFVLSAATSALLYAFATTQAWSLFSNVLYLPSLILMFAAEGLVRRCVLPPEERCGIADSIRAYLASSRPADAAPAHPSGNPIRQ